MLAFIFHRRIFKTPSSVGAVAPSSRFLAQTILAAADLKNCHVFVEFGPGIGAFTKYVDQQLRPDQRYVGIELNKNFARLLKRKFPTLTFVNDSVENLEATSAELNLFDRCNYMWSAVGVVTTARSGQYFQGYEATNARTYRILYFCLSPRPGSSGSTSPPRTIAERVSQRYLQSNCLEQFSAGVCLYLSALIIEILI